MNNLNDWDEASILPHYILTGMMASKESLSSPYDKSPVNFQRNGIIPFYDPWDHDTLLQKNNGVYIYMIPSDIGKYRYPRYYSIYILYVYYMIPSIFPYICTSTEDLGSSNCF